MKVAINTLFLIPGEVGGTETYLMETLGALARGHPDLALALVTNRENHAGLAERFGGYAQVRLHPMAVAARNRYARIVAEQTALPRLLRRLRPDVVWSPGYTAPWTAPCPQVVTIHDMQYRRFPEDLRPLARVATDVLVRMAARRCARVLAVSAFAREEIVRFTRAASGKVDVTPEAADPGFGAPLPEPEGSEAVQRLVGGGPFVLCVSNTYPHKNVAALIAAFDRVAASLPHKLVLVGRPRLGEPAVEAALRGARIASRIVRIERVSGRELVALYQRCAVFAFPSLYEGFGLPVLEALAAGVPVVAMPCAAVPEIGRAHV